MSVKHYDWSAIDFASTLVDLKPDIDLKNLNAWHKNISSRPSSQV